jgi:hypothetical protein
LGRQWQFLISRPCSPFWRARGSQSCLHQRVASPSLCLSVSLSLLCTTAAHRVAWDNAACRVIGSNQIAATAAIAKLRRAQLQPLNSSTTPNPLSYFPSPSRAHHGLFSNRGHSYPAPVRGDRPPIRTLPSAAAPIRHSVQLSVYRASFGWFLCPQLHHTCLMANTRVL